MYKERREYIANLLRDKPFVSLEELCQTFPGVSEMTLRRDIEHFEARGEAIKVRGGAKSTRYITEEKDDPYQNRKNENIQSKTMIAKCAARTLEVGRSIFIDSGSTIGQMVQFIPNERFTFTTTSPETALDLCRIGQPIVNLVGGRLDRDYQAVSGMQAMKFMENINIDIALLCPSGLSSASGFTGGNYNECELKRSVAKKAREVVMLLDLSKADKSLPYTFCDMEDVDILICDGKLPTELAELAKASGTRVIDATNEEF